MSPRKTRISLRYAWIPKHLYETYGKEGWWRPTKERIWLTQGWFFNGVYGQFFITQKAYETMMEIEQWHRDQDYKRSMDALLLYPQTDERVTTAVSTSNTPNNL